MEAGEGGVALVVFHCMFHVDESVTHCLHDIDTGFHEALPHLYAALISDNRGRLRRIPAGFFLKTNITHEEAGFSRAVCEAVRLLFEDELLSWETAFFPAQLAAAAHSLPSERQILHMMRNLRLMHLDAYHA